MEDLNQTQSCGTVAGQCPNTDEQQNAAPLANTGVALAPDAVQSDLPNTAKPVSEAAISAVSGGHMPEIKAVRLKNGKYMAVPVNAREFDSEEAAKAFGEGMRAGRCGHHHGNHKHRPHHCPPPFGGAPHKLCGDFHKCDK